MFSASMRLPSRPSHSNSAWVISGPGPRQNISSRMPSARISCGICEGWPNESGRYPSRDWPPSSRARRAPSMKLRICASPEQRYSSGSTYQGPMASLPCST